MVDMHKVEHLGEQRSWIKTGRNILLEYCEVTVPKMMQVQLNSVRDGCKASGCADDEADKVQAVLAQIDLGTIPADLLIQTSLQIVAIFRPAPKR